ncbi:hypothetical protein BDC45DRAFT_11089 [Circinella umbellata]|nr:hypothetical protein BDC45DRAFT_11089 [Circinella umbellata]
MDTIKSEFSRRYNSMINDYEEMGAVVRQLNKALKKKDDELSILRIRYQDAMAENDLLYEAFNNELDHMYDLFEQRSTRLNKREYSSSSLDDYDDEEEGEEEEQREQQENIIYHTHQKRPAHPSPEAQIRKKLELTIKERNQWHKTACKLARELQSLSQSTGNRSITPTSSSSTSSLSTTTGHGNNDNIRPGNSRSTPLPPFRHSTN